MLIAEIMNCIKFLNELMMKNGRSVKLNKKYFFAILTAFAVQIIIGVNLANAMPCEEFLKETWDKTEFTTNKAGKKVKEIYFDSYAGYWQVETFDEFKKIAPEVPTKYARTWLDYEDGIPLSESQKVKQCVSIADTRRNQEGRSRFQHCALNYLYSNRCDASAFASGVSGQSASSNQSSNSSTSSQSNKKTNRQSANNQSSSSATSDLSNKSRDQLIDIASSARERGDYAKSYAASLQLAKDPDPEISRQALRNAGFHLKEGQGVKQNLFEAHRLFQQAASMGDLSAHSHLCSNFMDGTGVAENHRTALEYCLFAAERGHMTAQANLAWLYENGNGIQRSQKLSDQWTCKAAAQGEEAAVGNLKKQNISCN